MQHQLHTRRFDLLPIIFTVLLAAQMPSASADNIPLLLSTIKDAPASIKDSKTGTTVAKVCAASLEIIESYNYAAMSAAEKARALTYLLRCLEINNAHDSAIKAVTEAAAEQQQIAKFYGLNFGVGFGFSQARKDIIKEATVVSGVVKSTVDRTDKMRLVFESHIFIACHKTKNGISRGCGPFLALATGIDESAAGVGIGWMWGWKNVDPNKLSGFSIGLGLLADNKLKTLAGGFTPDEPLPAGETAIRYENKSTCSSLLFVSHSF